MCPVVRVPWALKSVLLVAQMTCQQLHRALLLIRLLLMMPKKKLYNDLPIHVPIVDLPHVRVWEGLRGKK